MYLKNITRSTQGMSVGKTAYVADPGEVIVVPDELASDPTVMKVVARGAFERTSDDEGLKAIARSEEQADKRREEDRMKVMRVKDSMSRNVRMVPCAHQDAKGTCGCAVSVKYGEYDPDRPYFCSRHKSDDPSMYVREGNGWKLRDDVDAVAKKAADGDGMPKTREVRKPRRSRKTADVDVTQPPSGPDVTVKG